MLSQRYKQQHTETGFSGIKAATALVMSVVVASSLTVLTTPASAYDKAPLPQPESLLGETDGILGGILGSLPLGILEWPEGAEDPTVVARWNAALIKTVAQPDYHYGAPVVARSFAILNTCMYDAWAAYEPIAAGSQRGSELRQPFNERTHSNKVEAISFAAYRAAVDLFPTERERFTSLMHRLGFHPSKSNMETDMQSAAGVGNTACQAVLDFRHHDGANQMGRMNDGKPYSDYTGYKPVNAPLNVSKPIAADTVQNVNHWQPLIYKNKQGEKISQFYHGAHWGTVKPFAMTSSDQFRMPKPIQYPSPEFRQQCLELIEISANLTDRQKVIAEFWRLNPGTPQPPGVWITFAEYVSQRDNHNLEQDVRMFLLVANAVFDASIAAWDNKRVHDYVRPVTAIRYLFRDKQIKAWGGPGEGTKLIDGAMWRPYQPSWFPTPPFAEYISGHSTFSVAAAEVLKRFTGSDKFGMSVTIPAGSSAVNPGVTPSHDITLTWDTFTEAANQAGISRRYGGIHFAEADLDGRHVGRLVGEQVWKKSQSLFFNTANE